MMQLVDILRSDRRFAGSSPAECTKFMRLCRNWYTGNAENVVLDSMWVRVPPGVPWDRGVIVCMVGCGPAGMGANPIDPSMPP